MKITEEQIAKRMSLLGCSRDEAIALFYEDEEVDKMTSSAQILGDLTAEQKQNVKKMTKTGEKKSTTYKFDTKKRPKDDEKVEIVEKLAEFVKNFTENCEIANAGKEICFKMGENEYSLSLTKHRKAKG